MGDTTIQGMHNRLTAVVDTLIDEVRDNVQTLAGKVDAVAGKGLSSNDYTAEDKAKVAGIEVQELPVSLNDVAVPYISTGGDYQIKCIKTGNLLIVSVRATLSQEIMGSKAAIGFINLPDGYYSRCTVSGALRIYSDVVGGIASLYIGGSIAGSVSTTVNLTVPVGLTLPVETQLFGSITIVYGQE